MHVQSNRTHTQVHLYCTHSISGIQHMVYQILMRVLQKHESGFQIMPFTENTLALANMCLVIHVIHVMGKLFNIMKELSY